MAVNDRRMHAADRLLACRVLGIPFPQPPGEHERLNRLAVLLDRYDRDHLPYDVRRWLPDGHDPGDEDRS